MKRSVILVSNYIIFLSLLIGTITLGFVSELYDWALGFKNEDLSSVFLIGVFGSVFSFFTYGIFIWPAVLIVNICMETIGLKPKVSWASGQWPRYRTGAQKIQKQPCKACAL